MNYVTVNPCRMCQPIGTVFALKGIEKSMLLLHGSQGCATYMRRHISGHYNEPVDIASSALHEKGAIHGGDAFLKQGLRNVIAKYRPRVIGVATTCLSETIGDDIHRILAEFEEEMAGDPLVAGLPEGERPIIFPIRTPSYAANHLRGFDAALLAAVERLAPSRTSQALAAGGAPSSGQSAGRDRINILPGNLSPGDLRHLKDVLDDFGVSHILFPDFSETLDAPMGDGYQLLPDGGTGLDEIRAMSKSKATVRFGAPVDPQACPACFLAEEHGVPAHTIPAPIGLHATDRFLELLSDLTGQPVPARRRRERGRLLDALVDAHKIVFGRRPVIFGDPALVEGITSFCLEVGMEPALSVTSEDGLDFFQIHALTKEKGGDLLLGHDGGSFIAGDLGLPLIRVGFPISDRLGGQRQVVTGYEGAIRLLDRITDAILDRRDREGPSVAAC